MKSFAGIVLRAFGILLVFGSLGLLRNVFSSNPMPWIYIPPAQVTLSGVDIPLIDEKAAHSYFSDPSTVFVDTRKPEDYASAHVRGARSLSPDDDLEEQFLMIQPFISEENRLILYCYGPTCDMAERTADFLVRLGYKKLMIMSAGFRSWESSGFPTEASRSERNAGLDRRGEQ
jgi:rhodanese-related sulfurtransferase